MSAEPDQHLFQLFERVGILAGKVDSLLQAVTTWQSDAMRRDQRVETLEQRMNAMEGRLATREDLEKLRAEIMTLSTAKAEDRGRLSALGGFSSQLAPWAAVLIALLALVGSWRNRGDIIRQEQRLGPPPVVQGRK
jgi:hypothetical protein